MTDVPTKIIHYRTKIIPSDEEINFFAQYNFRTQQIHTYIRDETDPSTDVKWIQLQNNQALSKTNLAHEAWHDRNYTSGIYDLDMSLEEIYKLNIDDEISAKIAALHQLRQEYLDAQTPEARALIVNSPIAQSYSYYFSAIAQGKINPESTNPADFEEEMRFIAKETQKVWLTEQLEFYDKKQLAYNTQYYYSKHPNCHSNNENYQSARKTVYTIGGIDFSKYLEETPCLNENIYKADELQKENAPYDDIYNQLQPQDMTMGFLQTAAIAALTPLNSGLYEIANIRRNWLIATNLEERQKITAETPLAQKYLLALNQQEIIPNPLGMDEKEENQIGELLRQEYQQTVYAEPCPYVSFNQIENTRQALESDKAYENFYNLFYQNFSIGGIDFGDYLQPPIEDPIINDPFYKEIDDYILDGESPENIWKTANTPFYDEQTGLFWPPVKFNDELAAHEQLRVVQHEIFLQNVIYRHPELITECRESSEKLPSHLKEFCNEFQHELETNETLLEAWNNMTQYLAESIVLTPQPPRLEQDTQEKYQIELDDAYTYYGHNLRELYFGDVENLLPPTQLEKIEIPKNQENSSNFLGQQALDVFEFKPDHD